MLDIFINENIPKNLEESILHKQTVNKLLKLSLCGEILPNLLFYGFEGKRILIKLFLNKLFPGKIQLKTITEIYEKEITYQFSNFHIEIEVKKNLKTINKSLSSFLNHYKSCKSIINQPYKLAVIYNFDLLSIITQQELRRIIENKNFRIIIHCSKLNKIIEPLRSRCLPLRIPSISIEEGVDFYKHLSKKYEYKLTKIKDLVDKASFNNIISVKKIKLIFHMKLILKENKSRHNIHFDNDTVLSNITNELDTVGKMEPFKIMDNCVCHLMIYLKRGYNISDLYSHLIYYITQLKISNDRKHTIIALITQIENERHSRIIVTLETIMAQVIDLLNM